MKRISELVLSTEGRQAQSLSQPALNTEDDIISRVTDRTADLIPGSLFFAVKGTKVDGHDLVQGVLSQGAVGAVVERLVEQVPLKFQILVRDTRAAHALAQCRWYENPSHRLGVVGVTGTNGKTTTTFLLHQMWLRLGLVAGVIGTVETRIGNQTLASELTTPAASDLQRTFSQMVDHGVRWAAMEVSSIALDQKRSYGTRFAQGIFTNLSQDHLDYHGDWEAYFQAKLKLFKEHEVGMAIINTDSEWGKRFRLEVGAGALTFGTVDSVADFFLTSAETFSDLTRAKVRTPSGSVSLTTRLFGRHNLANLIGALASAYASGFDLKEVAEVLSRAEGAPGRLERVAPLPTRPKVFVDYAHTPDALENVLRTLGEVKSKSAGTRVITVFGCGGDRDRGKRPLMAEVVSRLSDLAILTSDNPRTEDPDAILDEIEAGMSKGCEYRRECDRRSAIELALSLASANDLVLIAGKGHETYQIIGREKFPFDDREVIHQYYDLLSSGKSACTPGSDLVI